jgi:hypothetical protein
MMRSMMTMSGREWRVVLRGAWLAGAALAVVLGLGCGGSQGTNEQRDQGARTGPQPAGFESPGSFRLRVGDKLKIEIRDTPTQMPGFETQIRDDGTITLPLLINTNKTIKAADKRLGDL